MGCTMLPVMALMIAFSTVFAPGHGQGLRKECRQVIRTQMCIMNPPPGDCTTKSDCRRNELCCSTQCDGNQCTKDYILCPDVKCSSPCKLGFAKDAKGCTTCTCNPDPNAGASTPAPVQDSRCPAVAPGTMGECVDDGCKFGQPCNLGDGTEGICCSTGCGKLCRAIPA